MYSLIDASERRQPMPAWLTSLDSELPTPLPLKEVLRDSLYYPASGIDGDPVACLSGRVHSFIYVDYGVSLSSLERTLQTAPFVGYRILARRSVAREELAPIGWSPAIVPNAVESEKLRAYLSDFDINPSAAYCEWLVFERNDDKDSSHGPHRFSMLFLFADGAASYQALYSRNGIAPAILAIIQPGTGFGRAYTDFNDPTALLHRSVFTDTNVTPEMLVTGHINREAVPDTEPTWSEYGTFESTCVTPSHRLHVWTR